MSNYQRYPTVADEDADLARRIGNLETEQTLLGRIATLETAVTALEAQPVWVQRTLPTPNPGCSFQAVGYGNGQFVALARGFYYTGDLTAATSPDGVTWTQRAMPVASRWQAVAYGNGVFVAVSEATPSGSGGNVAAISPDGITWTQRTLPVVGRWDSLAYGNGVFVAFCTNGSTVAATSPDGITWTQRAMPSAGNWLNVTYGNAVFVAFSQSNIAATSPDGITWTQRTLPAFLTIAAFGNGTFVAVGPGKAAATSPDGVTWTSRVMPGAAPQTGRTDVPDWSSIAFGSGVFTVLSNGYSLSVGTSADGITWKVSSDLPAEIDVAAMTWGGGVFVAVGSTAFATTPPQP